MEFQTLNRPYNSRSWSSDRQATESLPVQELSHVTKSIATPRRHNIFLTASLRATPLAGWQCCQGVGSWSLVAKLGSLRGFSGKLKLAPRFILIAFASTRQLAIWPEISATSRSIGRLRFRNYWPGRSAWCAEVIELLLCP